MTILEKKLKQVVAKGGIKSKADAMRKAGYSPRTARTPKKAKVWPKLLEEYLPDQDLLTVHKGLLDHEEWQAQNQGLDKAYKLKGRYADGTTINQQFNVGEMKIEIE